MSKSFAKAMFCFSIIAMIGILFGMSAFTEWKSDKQETILVDKPTFRTPRTLSSHQVEFEATKRMYEECLLSLTKEQCEPLYNLTQKS